MRLAALILVAAAGLTAGCGGEVVMPDVVGLPGDDAVARVCSAGLRPTPAPPAAVVSGTSGAGWTAYTPFHTLSLPIAETLPHAGARVGPGGEVVLRARHPHTDALFVVHAACR